MDFNLAMGILYIFDIALSTLGIGMILMLAKSRLISLEGKNAAALAALVCIFLLSLLYFVIDYYSYIMGDFGWGMFIRVFDIWLCVALNFSVLIYVKCAAFSKISKRICRGVCICYAVIFAETLVNYGFLIDEEYHAKTPDFETVSMVFQYAQVVIILPLFIVCIIALAAKTKNVTEAGDLRFAGIIGLVLAGTTGVQNSYYGILYIKGIETVYSAGPEYGLFDVTAVCHMGLALLMLWYVVKYCFINVYNRNYVKGDAAKEKKSADEALREISVDSELTARECDIVKMLYHGDTYQRIADELFISKNTVKHHVSSIYRKTGVSSKMDLMELVREIQQTEK